MGQQQLLLIVLGVIIVGIAVVVGLNVFSTSSIDANVNAMIADMQNISADANAYYLKPTNMGGGGNTYTGYVIAANLATTPNAAYALTIAAQTITVVGTSEIDAAAGGKVTVTGTITRTGLNVAAGDIVK